MSSLDEIAIQNRKLAKTCVEKKRRDRINRCLDELKEIMSQTDDKARYQKMEKAEILEMAVSYMKSVTSKTNQNQDINYQSYYVMAYQQCLSEFQNYLNVVPGVRDDFKSRIMNHMSQRYLEIASKQNELKASKTKGLRYSPYYNNRVSPVKKELNENSLLYQQNTKFGGSCSSLDSFININVQPNSPYESETAYDVQNLSANSSPALSECSSPVSSKKCDLESNISMSNSSCEMVWRPW